MITQERLHELVKYDPHTGIFTNRITRNNSSQIGRVLGSVNKVGYSVIRLDYKLYAAHRLAFLYMVGRMPSQIDHINGDRANNTWANLREVTSTQNRRNTAIGKNNTSGVLGVCWDKRRNKWKARIGKKELGYYSDFFEAVCVRKSAERKHGYHPNHGRAA